ncbi:MBL fold metallo-hydrolase [Archangium lansingense]|uniref:MBL fold metallo-hydrolase n=1 Tax=Archangium lansingense TaxID=2995310 RepID=UPI003B7C097A
MMLGDFEVTTLSDGTLELPLDKMLTNIKPAQVEKAFAPAFLETPVESSFNAFLINTGSQLVLVDTGAGNLYGPTLGKLLTNLKAAGYQPEQIDAVLITHLHPDHMGGLMTGDKRTFRHPRARATSSSRPTTPRSNNSAAHRGVKREPPVRPPFHHQEVARKKR